MVVLSAESGEEEVEETFAAPLSPEVQWYLDSRGYDLPEQTQPLWRTPEPRDVPGAFFNPDLVDKAINALTSLRHTQGKWAGQPLAPDTWQVAYLIAPVFGWVHVNREGKTVRIIRSIWIEIPRKNGKTTLAAAIALLLAFGDGEKGAQVYAAAASRGQAELAYNPAKLIAEKTPAFRRAGIKAWKKEIIKRRDGSFMRAVASVGDLIQGTNPNGYIADEVHIHKGPEVIDALESGVGARDQPLGMLISTADDGRTHTVYALRRKEIEELCSGTLVNPTKAGVIFAAPKNANPHKEETWARANPGYPVSPTYEFMAAESDSAKASEERLARFKRFNLNIRAGQESKYIPLGIWDRNAGRVDETELKGMTCFSGLDLASVSDLSAACHVFPHGDGTFTAIWRFWTPEDNLVQLNQRTSNAANDWVKRGFLTVTPGNVTDYNFIEADLVADSESFDMRGFGYDPFGATQLVGNLQDVHGLPMVKVRQGFYTLSQPTKEVKRLLLKGTRLDPQLRHGANPVMRWMTDNLAVEYDAAGNVKPTKSAAGGKARNKIDGWAALVTAMSECIADNGGSIFSDRGITVI